jgi:segregation and condensation protein B
MTDQLKEIIETLIFISVEPITLEKIKAVLEGVPEEEIKQALEELVSCYASHERGIHIIQTAGGYLFSTKQEFDPWIRRLLQIDKKSKLSSQALETLSTVAYHQPVTLAEISSIRGVDSSYALKTLLQKKFVKIVGRKSSPGRPLIYRTTENFLSYFGLNSIQDLPSKEEISKLLEEDQT